jgi:hypothetical protein
MNAKRLLAPYDALQQLDLDPSSRELPFEVIYWVEHADGKQYACISPASEACFLASEAKRGSCTLVKHKDISNQSCLRNVTFLCSYSKERHSNRKIKQGAIAAAARMVRDSSQKASQLQMPNLYRLRRLEKNSTGEAVTCASSKYRLQLKVFKERPGSLFLVLASAGHSIDDRRIPHLMLML